MIIKGSVSIITPAYNAEQYIQFAIDSVFAQTYNSWEMIIIDDCSTDSTFDICKKNAVINNRIRVLQTKQSSGNPSVPRNIGIEQARGEFIAYLDADDMWLPHKLMLQVSFMTKHDYPFTYASYGFIDQNGKKINKVLNAPESISYRQLIKTCNIGCLTVMYNVEIIGKQYFVTEKCQEDYIHWLTIVKKVGRAYGIKEILSMYRITPFSYSGNKIKVARRTWDVYRKYEKMNLVRSVYYFLTFFSYWIKKNYFN